LRPSACSNPKSDGRLSMNECLLIAVVRSKPTVAVSARIDILLGPFRALSGHSAFRATPALRPIALICSMSVPPPRI
jgi:hypothetical protein